MGLLEGDASRLRFEADIEDLASAIGHADRPPSSPLDID